MNEYTKGEWKTQKGGNHKEGECCIISELGKAANGMMIIRTIGGIYDYAGIDESNANAQLIAQAPRMYEFIKNIGLHLAVNYDDENEPYFIIDKEYLAEAHTITAKAGK